LNAEFIGADRIFILGVVKALTSSGEMVEEAINQQDYDTILLSITDEEVDGLREFLKHPIEIEMDDVEIIYEYLMRKFGRTSIPPAAYIKAISLADRKKIRVSGIDIPSGTYEDLFVNSVKLSDMILLSLKKRRLMSRSWAANDPESFSLAWDKYLSKGGYLKMERERAKYMASEIVKRKKSNTLVVMEIERYNDVVNGLSSLLQGYKLRENSEVMKEVLSSKPF
jgi:pheromone shutdown protein TraB